jgi:hypothetical protein
MNVKVVFIKCKKNKIQKKKVSVVQSSKYFFKHSRAEGGSFQYKSLENYQNRSETSL